MIYMYTKLTVIQFHKYNPDNYMYLFIVHNYIIKIYKIKRKKNTQVVIPERD